ncbi:MAG: ankyrin repeat domain-containing protein [Gammaproteobacteria bacterium]|jgi:ankyrin repeat protein
MTSDHQYVIDVLANGSEEALEELAVLVDGFPGGRDELFHQHWITHAIDHGSEMAIRWMLRKGVALDFCDEAGNTALSCCIDRDRPDRLDIAAALIEAGAPLDIHGINDWTPLHKAAARDDIEMLRLLVERGADTSARTRIDDRTTPLEEAKLLGKTRAAAYLESLG